MADTEQSTEHARRKVLQMGRWREANRREPRAETNSLGRQSSRKDLQRASQCLMHRSTIEGVGTMEILGESLEEHRHAGVAVEGPIEGVKCLLVPRDLGCSNG